MARHYRGGISRIQTRRQRIGVRGNQMETLVSYMEQHSLFARGQVPRLGPQGHIKYQKMWEGLAVSLNNIGPVTKDVKAWQRFWTQLRLSAKSNKSRFLVEFNRTGHTSPQQTLSDIDERISNIFGHYGAGTNIGLELGMQLISNPASNELTSTIEELMQATVQVFDEILLRYQDNLVSGFGSRRNPIQAQLNELLNLISQSPEVLREDLEDPMSYWDGFAQTLNSIEGGCVKQGKAWQKTWTDLLLNARRAWTMILDGDRFTTLCDNHRRAVDLAGYKRVGPPVKRFLDGSCGGSSLAEDGNCESGAYDTVNIPEKVFKCSNGAATSAPPHLFGSSRSTSVLPGTPAAFVPAFAPPFPSSSTSSTSVLPGTLPAFAPGYGLPLPTSSTRSTNVLQGSPSAFAPGYGRPLPTSSTRSTNVLQGTPSATPLPFSSTRSTSMFQGILPSTSAFAHGRNIHIHPGEHTPSSASSVAPARTTTFSPSATPFDSASALSTGNSTQERSSRLVQQLGERARTLLDVFSSRLQESVEQQSQMMQDSFEQQNRILLDNVPIIVRQELSVISERLPGMLREIVQATSANDRVVAVQEEMPQVDAASQMSPPLPPAIEPEPENSHANEVADRDVDYCVICHESLRNPKTLKCNHIFCYQCIRQWLKDRFTCSTCRGKVDYLERYILTNDVVADSESDDSSQL